LTEYYSSLLRAVASLEPNTAQTRAALFERGRQMLLDRIEEDSAHWTPAEIEAELAKFDDATDRIESDIMRRTIGDQAGRYQQRQPAAIRPAVPSGVSDVDAPRPIGRILVWGAAGLVGVLLIGLAGYVFLGGSTIANKGASAVTVTAVPDTAKKAAARPALDGEDLEPGIDGGSTDAGLPYYLRRQAVYYRSVYSAGMIVVDRSQRFLYLVQPGSKALRYGIGVGGECAVSAGLYRIQSKSQWPEWSPSPALRKRRSYPVRLAGGPGNPLGAYAFYFEAESPGIHGTNAPLSIGNAPSIGCFRLVNNDIVDLEKRVAIGTGVVVLN
jgi:lipoprotein-anchoring transpeptidase ErfK/SrfK